VSHDAPPETAEPFVCASSEPVRHAVSRPSGECDGDERCSAGHQDQTSAELVAGNTIPGLLLELHDVGLIDPYVLFSLGDDGIARDYKPYRTANRTKLEEYMDKFVMPPAPAGN
jgi:hypothetical protein